MAEKVEKLGVNRDKDFMYYVKDGAVWRVQRKQPGVTKGRPEKVADGAFQMDTNFIYFVDKDGDVSRAKRAVGGQKRKKSGGKSRSSRGAAKKSPAKRMSAKSKPGVKARGTARSSKAGAKGRGKAKGAASARGKTKAQGKSSSRSSSRSSSMKGKGAKASSKGGAKKKRR